MSGQPKAPRYCTSCQRTQPEAGGYKKPGSNRGWRCATCLAHLSSSIYASPKPAQAAQFKIRGEVWETQ